MTFGTIIRVAAGIVLCGLCAAAAVWLVGSLVWLGTGEWHPGAMAVVMAIAGAIGCLCGLVVVAESPGKDMFQ